MAQFMEENVELSPRVEMANPRPKNKFLCPKLGSKFSDLSIWKFFFIFYQNVAQNVNILAIFPNAAQR
jgi:hypothetical protein